jgi:hypothetical protein
MVMRISTMFIIVHDVSATVVNSKSSLDLEVVTTDCP